MSSRASLEEAWLGGQSGSVGQPKHGGAEACYAIWQDGKLSLGSAAYDVEQTVEKLRRLSLSSAVYEDLAFVLRNGSVPAAPEDADALPPQVP